MNCDLLGGNGYFKRFRVTQCSITFLSPSLSEATKLLYLNKELSKVADAITSSSFFWFSALHRVDPLTNGLIISGTKLCSQKLLPCCCLEEPKNNKKVIYF